MFQLRPVHVDKRQYLVDRNALLEETKFGMLSIDPLSVALGGKVNHINLDHYGISKINFDDLYKALMFYKVLVFEDQKLSDSDLLNFRGKVEEYEVGSDIKSCNDKIIHVSTKKNGPSENVWHIDGTWNSEPPASKMLYAKEMPPLGGGTVFCNLVACYESLDATIKDMITPLYAIHDIRHAIKYKKNIVNHPEFPKKGLTQVHPIVKIHPVTKEKILYINTAVMSKINGLAPNASEKLLSYLIMQQTYPEFQCHIKWNTNTLVIWDNRSLSHYAINDYWPKTRHLVGACMKGKF